MTTLARFLRLLENGRVYVTRAIDVERLCAALDDVEIEHSIRFSPRGGWWVSV